MRVIVVHRPDGAVGAARARAGRLDRAARLLPGRGGRRRRTGPGSCTSRSSSRSPARRSRRSRPRASGSTSTSTTSSTSREVTPEAERYSTFQGIHAAHRRRPPTVARADRRRSSSASATRTRSTRSASSMRERVRGPAVGDEVAAVLPRVRGARASRRPRRSTFLADRLGFARERTVTIGDGENDLDLVAWGYGVAVENADERVKARGALGLPARRRRRVWPQCSRRF